MWVTKRATEQEEENVDWREKQKQKKTKKDFSTCAVCWLVPWQCVTLTLSVDVIEQLFLCDASFDIQCVNVLIRLLNQQVRNDRYNLCKERGKMIYDRELGEEWN